MVSGCEVVLLCAPTRVDECVCVRFLNFPIPFSKSVVVTAQHMYGTFNFYMIVRGVTNLVRRTVVWHGDV